MNAVQPQSRSLRALDAALGKATTGITAPTRIALAAYVRGAALRVHPSRVTAWLTDRRPETADLLSDPAVSARLAAVARSRVAAAGSSAARREMTRQIASRWLAWLTSPLDAVVDRHGQPIDVTARSLNSARAALSVIAIGIIRDVAAPGKGRGNGSGFDTALVSQADLGVKLGVTRLAARKALLLCVELGWLSVVKRMPGGMQRLRLGRVYGEDARLRMALLSDSTDALVDVVHGEHLDDIPMDVQVLLSSDSPTWAYPAPRPPGARIPTEVARTSWLLLLADSLDSDAGYRLDPEADLGLSRRLVSVHRTLLWKDLGLATNAGDLRDLLRTYGERTGALERARWAVEQRRAEKEARVDEVEAARARKRAAVRFVSGALDRVEAEVGVRVPIGPDPAWARALRDTMSDLDPTLVVAAQKEVTRVLAKAGIDGDLAARLAEKIVAPQPAAA